MTIASVDYVDDTERVAMWASTVLAADKGIPSRIVPTDGCAGHDVCTDEGTVFRFLQK